MSSNSNNLEAVKGSVPVYLIDTVNKRRLKKSTPTAILNLFEKYPNSTAKEIENKAVKITAVKNGYKIALAKAVAVGKEPFTLRTYTARRIKAVITYYSASDVIKDVFNGNFPLIRRVKDGLDRFTLGVLDNSA